MAVLPVRDETDNASPGGIARSSATGLAFHCPNGGGPITDEPFITSVETSEWLGQEIKTVCCTPGLLCKYPKESLE